MTASVVEVCYSLVFFVRNIKTITDCSELRTESLYRQYI